MAKKIAPTTKPEPKPYSVEKAREDLDDVATMIQRNGAQAAAEVAEEFAAKVASNGLAYALEWADNFADTAARAQVWVYVAACAERAIEAKRPRPLEHAVQVMIKRLTEDLLGNRYACSSTSLYTRAAREAEAKAAARFIEDGAGWVLRTLTKAYDRLEVEALTTV